MLGNQPIKPIVDTYGQMQILEALGLSFSPSTHIVLSCVPFLPAPASWCMTVLLYATCTPSRQWFLARPIHQYQALVIKTQTPGRWHVVDVPRPQPGVQEVTRDILLVMGQHIQDEAGPVVIYEVPSREDKQYGCFQVCQGCCQWSVGLSQDDDGPYYTVLASSGGNDVATL